MMRRKRGQKRFSIPIESERIKLIKEACKQVVESKKEKKQRKAAERMLQNAMRDRPGKSLIQLLSMIIRRYPLMVAKLAIERIERNQLNILNWEDRTFFEECKKLLMNREKEEAPQQNNGAHQRI